MMWQTAAVSRDVPGKQLLELDELKQISTEQESRVEHKVDSVSYV